MNENIERLPQNRKLININLNKIILNRLNMARNNFCNLRNVCLSSIYPPSFIHFQEPVGELQWKICFKSIKIIGVKPSFDVEEKGTSMASQIEAEVLCC
jgi:hypothetical protein